MERKNNHQLTNFWFGFLIGGLTLLTTGYFLGTKQGRKNLHQLLVFFEDFENNLKDLLTKLENINTKDDKSSSPLLSGVIDKIKTLSKSH
jgi:hypothetical protein